MPNEPEQLDRDASLMLYVAGEMTAAQRALFDAQLASDPALAADLQSLRATMDRMDAGLRDLDEHQRGPMNAAVAVRRVERAMQQWAVNRLRAPAPDAPAIKRMPWWSYPVAAAVLLIVGFLVWSGRQQVEPMASLTNPQSEQMMAEAEALADRLDAEFTVPEPGVEDSTQLAVDDVGTFFINPSEVASW